MIEKTWEMEEILKNGTNGNLEKGRSDKRKNGKSLNSQISQPNISKGKSYDREKATTRKHEKH